MAHENKKMKTITFTAEEMAALRTILAYKAEVVFRSSGNYDDTLYATFEMGSPYDATPVVATAVGNFNTAVDILRRKL